MVIGVLWMGTCGREGGERRGKGRGGDGNGDGDGWRGGWMDGWIGGSVDGWMGGGGKKGGTTKVQVNVPTRAAIS